MSDFPSLIGLSGFARSGKDTAAACLKPYGYTQVALADPLRAIAYDLNPLLPSGFRLSQRVDAVGWEGIKADPVDAPELRRMLIALGMSCRERLGPSVWVDALRARFAARGPGERIVVSDVRLANEAQAVHDLGGVVIRVTRPGVGPAVRHVTEQPLPDDMVEATVVNDGSVTDLAGRLVELLDDRSLVGWQRAEHPVQAGASATVRRTVGA